MKWFQMFDSAMIDGILRRFVPAQASVTYYKYEERQWRKASAADCRDGYYFDIHTGIPYNKNFPAGAQCVACVEIRK